MNEALFLATFGNESNLRIFEGLRQRGEASIYEIGRVTGLDRKTMRPHLEMLLALDLVDVRVEKNTNLNYTSRYWKLNLTNPIMQRVLALLRELHPNGSPRPW